MTDQYQIKCECKAIYLTLQGEPKVRGYCHCEDCRDFFKVPYHSVTAWEKGSVTIDSGNEFLKEFQHPSKQMKRCYCSQCGETLFNTNKMDWRIVSQLLIRKCYDNKLPKALQSTKHFYYGQRIINIDDELPKQH